jgi:hypothetical protein
MLGPATGYNPVRDLRIAVVHCLLLAYGPTAYVVLIHRTRRTWTELQGLLGLSDAALQAAKLAVARRSRWIMFALVVTALLAWLRLTYATTPGDPFDLGDMQAEVVWHRVLGPILFVYASLLAASIVSISWALSSASRRIDHLDLLDPDQLAPFKAQALTHSLLILGMAACASPFGFETYLFGLFVGIWVVAAAVAGTGLLPLVGVRGQIRSLRAAELGWCDTRLREARDVLKREGAAAQAGRFSEISAYRARLERVSEWPLDAPSYVRFALYLLIPLGSWLGGAVVERIVDAVVK